MNIHLIKGYILFFTFTLILTPSFKINAQNILKSKIKGVITDLNTGEPVSYCNVFLSNTTRGAASGNDGKYEIDDIPNGPYTLVISHIGYETQTFHINILKFQTIEINAKLKPEAIQSKEVQVIGEEPADWKKYLKIFTREFLGTDYYSEKCKILNPEVLNFKYNDSTGSLTATADSTLRVENDAIGYLIDLVLVKFMYNEDNRQIRFLVYPKFKELKNSDESEARNWKENREEIYNGSLRQFLSDVAKGKVGESGYEIIVGNLKNLLTGFGFYLDPDSLKIVPVAFSDLKKFYLDNSIKVTYRNSIDKIPSFLKPTGKYILIDTLGNVYNNYPNFAFETYGAWVQERISHLLPLDYVPGR